MATSKPSAQKPRGSLTSVIINCFLLLMFAVFPLFVQLTADAHFPFLHFDGGFYGIRHEKLYFFLAVAAVTLIAELMVIVTNIGTDKSESPLKLTPLSFTDWAALALLFVCAVSTVFSPHPMLALLGEWDGVGRNNGLLLILTYVLVYFLITRCWRFSVAPFIGMAIGCGLVYLLTVLNGYYIDPLNMYAEFVNNEQVYTEFLATIGNKNMLSSFICVTLPVILSMSVYAERLWVRALCLASTVLGGAAIIVCDSDSCLLGVGVFAVIFFIVYLRDFAKLRRYLLGVSCLLAGVVLLRGFSALMQENYKKLGDESKAILYSNGTLIALGAVAALTALVWFISVKKPAFCLPKAAPVALLIAAGMAVVGALGVLFYFSVIDTETKLGSLEKVLRMNDAWGTHRGIMWLRSFRIFGEANVFQKLFGTGPDTFYYAFEPYFEELLNYGNSSTDAAHNEYLNYLITIGVFGLAAYVAFVGGALKRAFAIAKQRPVVLAFAAGAVAYAAQAVLNISVPISAPLMMIMVSLCEAAARQEALHID